MFHWSHPLLYFLLIEENIAKRDIGPVDKADISWSNSRDSFSLRSLFGFYIIR